MHETVAPEDEDLELVAIVGIDACDEHDPRSPRLGELDLGEGRFEELPGGGVRVAGRELGPEEVLVERSAPPGWAIAAEDGLLVGLTTELDDELVREGRVLDLIHAVNAMRKEAGLELTDRIVLTLPEADRDLLDYEEQIKTDTLAVRVEVRDELRVEEA